MSFGDSQDQLLTEGSIILENDNKNIGVFQSIMSPKARALLEMLDQTVLVLQKEEGFYDNDEKAEADLIIKLIEPIQSFLLAGDQGSEEKTIRVLKTFLALRGREIGQRGYTFSPFSKVNQACLAIATAIQEEQAVCQLLIPSVQPSPEESGFDYTQNAQLFSPEQFMLLETQQLIHIPTLMEYALTNTSNLFPCDNQNIKPIYPLSNKDRIFLQGCAAPSSNNLYTALKDLHDIKYATLLGALENFEQALRNSSVGKPGLTVNEQNEREDKADLAELLEPMKHFYELWTSLSEVAHQQIDSLTIQYFNSTISLKSLINFILVNGELVSSDAEVEEANKFPIMNCTKLLSNAIRQFCEKYHPILSSIMLNTDVEAHTISEIDELYSTFLGELSNPEIRGHLTPLELSSTLLFNEARFYGLVELSFQNDTSEKIENFIEWIKQLTYGNLLGFFELEQYALLDLSLEEIMILFQEKYKELLQTPEQLWRMLSCLPEGQRNGLIIALGDHIKTIIKNNDEFAYVLERLPEAEKSRLIIALGDYIKTIIKDINGLILVLKSLSSTEQRRDLIKILCKGGIKAIIKNGNELAWLLDQSPEAERSGLITALGDELKNIIKKGSRLAWVLERLPEAERSLLLTALGDHIKTIIKDSVGLTFVLQILPQAERGELIITLGDGQIRQIIHSSVGLNLVLNTLPSEEKSRLITALGYHCIKKLITNRDELISILEKLDVAAKSRLIIGLRDHIKSFIKDIRDLTLVLKCFPKGEKIRLIIEFGEHIPLIRVLDCLSKEEKNRLINTLGNNIKGLIKNIHDLTQVLYCLPLEERGKLITSIGSYIIKNIIKNRQDLIEVLESLEEEERSWLIGVLSDHIKVIIKNSDDFIQVLNLLPKVEKTKLITTIGGDIIKNSRDLIKLLDQFPEDEHCLNIIFLVGGKKSSTLLSTPMRNYERVNYDRYVALAKAAIKAENIILKQKNTGKNELSQIKLILESYCNPGLFKKHHNDNIEAITAAINTNEEVEPLLNQCAIIARSANRKGTFFALNTRLHLEHSKKTSAANLAL